MADYNAQDLQSTLMYIKNRFGMNVFTTPGRVPALFSDLAPSLKEDRVMLERMSRLGILEGFVNTDGSSEREKKMFVSKTITRLTESEFIRAKIAATYVAALVEVFGWRTVVVVPKEYNKEPFKFDSQRYLREIKDDTYLQADRAYAKEDYANAKMLFNRANVYGNIHAGIRLGQMYWNGDGCDIDYEKAIQLFVVGESQGNPLANEWLVEAYRMGKGVPKDKEKAEELSNLGQKALLDMCTLNDPDAMYMVGWNYINSPFYTAIPQLGYSWYEKAANKGHVKAKVQMAICLIEGTGCIQNVNSGLQILESLVRATNNASANYQLGKLYYLGKKVEQDYTKARLHFEAAAAYNNKFAQDYLGDIYYWGEGVEKNYIEARKWYLKAFDCGITNAAKQLGFIYYYGEGVDRNIDEAYRFFKKAADEGNARSQYMLHHFCFVDGKYKNHEVGCTYLIQSAEAGDVLAQTLLSRLYIGASYGLPQSDEKFIYWIQKAAEQGHAEAEYILGTAYAEFCEPDVLPVDFEQAAYWVQKAADQDYSDAIIKLAEYYYKGSGVEKNYQIASEYAQKYEVKLIEGEGKGSKFPDSWYKLAKYYELAEKSSNKALDCYWKAFQDGNMDALYDVGWEALIKGKESSYSTMDSYSLMLYIEKEAKKSISSNLAYLLGVYNDRNKYNSAEDWYKMAVEKGSIVAKCKLAILYSSKQQYVLALKYAQEAFDDGSAEGARLLGLCYKKGIGTKKDKRKAKEIFKIAVDRGSEDAATELKKFFF